MKKFLLIYAVGATLLLIAGAVAICCTIKKNQRLRNNFETLTTETKFYKTRLGESAASTLALQLELDEFRKLHAQDVERIKALKLKLRRVESIATTAAESEVAVSAPLRDTIIIRESIIDTLSHFAWSDKWVSIEGLINGEKVDCNIHSIDTIRQIIHRVPRRFLFIPYGTKAIRQEVVSSNPHTHIVYSEYIELPKRRGKR